MTELEQAEQDAKEAWGEWAVHWSIGDLYWKAVDAQKRLDELRKLEQQKGAKR